MYTGKYADLDTFFEAKKEDESNYKVFTFNTTLEEEAQIVKNIGPGGESLGPLSIYSS